MKLHELGAPRQSEQIAKVLETYSNHSIDVSVVGPARARGMLRQVRGLLAEHRSKPAFHRSEQNPAYLKMVMLEQALTAHLKEQDMAQPGATSATLTPQDKSKIAATAQARKKEIQDEIRAKQDEIRALQQQMNNPSLGMAESRRALRRSLSESEIQQAQVVLAAQDMIDRIQKMLEDISEMQFKDLPALVDSAKNDMGTEQATRFQADASAALSQLLTSVQTGKQALESAQGALTGQAPVVPGADAAAAPMPGAELDASAELDDLDAAADDTMDLDADLDAAADGMDLGRDRR